MAASAEFGQYLHDLFSEFGPITIRNMFGGGGIFHDGVMVGLVAEDTVYLKADAETVADFEAEGMGPFTYTAKGRRMRMSYWEVPHGPLDDPAEFAVWAKRAHEAALRARK